MLIMIQKVFLQQDLKVLEEDKRYRKLMERLQVIQWKNFKALLWINAKMDSKQLHQIKRIGKMGLYLISFQIIFKIKNAVILTIGAWVWTSKMRGKWRWHFDIIFFDNFYLCFICNSLSNKGFMNQYFFTF